MNQRVIEYIDKCLEHLNKVYQFEKHTEDEIEYSRSFLQHAYQEIFQVLDGIATAKESDIIKKSLMAGRIYYHAVKYGSVTDDQIKLDYDDRFYALVNKVYDQNEFRENSNETVLRDLVKDGVVIEKDKKEKILQEIRTVCREDIVRIETLREKLKSRQVFIVTT